MDWESAWNVLHYEVIERRLAKVVRRLSHHWQAAGVLLAELWSGRWLPLPSRQETHMDVDTPAVASATMPVLGQAILSRMDQQGREAIVAAIRAEITKEVREQSVVDARSALEEEFERRRIRLQDQVAKAREQAEADAELRIDSAVAKGLDAARAELEETVVELREERDQARSAQESITDVLLSIIRQVIPPRKTYLHSRGIVELDLYRLNIVLKSCGLRVRSEAVPGSERQVSTILNTDTTQTRALFWTEGVKGAADEDEPMVNGIPAKHIVRP